MPDKQATVNALQGRVKNATSKLANFKGKFEAAKKSKADVEEECKSKKINPEKIDNVREQLEQKFQKESTALDEKINTVENSLEAYQEA